MMKYLYILKGKHYFKSKAKEFLLWFESQDKNFDYFC